MPLGLVGTKLGMSRVFAEDGGSIPVTVLQVEPNRITRVKTAERDGYAAVQVTTGTRRPNRVNKPLKGQFVKAGVEAGSGLWEFKLDVGEAADLEPGGQLTVDRMSAGQKVDVIGISIGKGYAGVVKRHGFGGGRASHGASLTHRAGGSIGQCQDPGRVFPGKKMAGQMGNVQRTQQNLTVVQIDVDRQLLLIKGSVPGPKGANVIIKPAIKANTG